ncbi:MAG: hypothetical protein H6729_12220 [Deltaproteobacteria bacterium]|nr:hypothetical protein [Deltaproteobacteria bacterium]
MKTWVGSALSSIVVLALYACGSASSPSGSPLNASTKDAGTGADDSGAGTDGAVLPIDPDDPGPVPDETCIYLQDPSDRNAAEAAFRFSHEDDWQYVEMGKLLRIKTRGPTIDVALIRKQGHLYPTSVIVGVPVQYLDCHDSGPNTVNPFEDAVPIEIELTGLEVGAFVQSGHFIWGKFVHANGVIDHLWVPGYPIDFVEWPFRSDTGAPSRALRIEPDALSPDHTTTVDMTSATPLKPVAFLGLPLDSFSLVSKVGEVEIPTDRQFYVAEGGSIMSSYDIRMGHGSEFYRYVGRTNETVAIELPMALPPRLEFTWIEEDALDLAFADETNPPLGMPIRADSFYVEPSDGSSSGVSGLSYTRLGLEHRSVRVTTLLRFDPDLPIDYRTTSSYASSTTELLAQLCYFCSIRAASQGASRFMTVTSAVRRYHR